MIDGDRLPREVEGDAALRPDRLCALNARIFLRHADDDDVIDDGPARPIVGDDVVFALAPRERDQRNVLRRGVSLHRADEAIEHGREQRRRRNRMAHMIPEEIAEAA